MKQLEILYVSNIPAKLYTEMPNKMNSQTVVRAVDNKIFGRYCEKHDLGIVRNMKKN